VLVLLATSCSLGTTIKEDVFALKCSGGKLILHETFVPRIADSPVTLELFFVTGSERRLICELRQLVVLYQDPKPEQHYLQLRDGGPSDAWPVFVSPTAFTLAEYRAIRDTLSQNLALIDEAVTKRKKSMRELYDHRRPMLSSTRYIDVDALRFTYADPKRGVSLVVSPQGRVDFVTKDARSYSEKLVGYVTGNGESIVLNPKKDGWAYWAWRPIDNLKVFFRDFVSEDNRTIFEDFSVTIPENYEEYRKAGKAWVNRRDSRL
jgi:hypothetical protein